VKQLQITLSALPNRNQLTALQSALQSLNSMLRFVMTFTLDKPDQFKWTTLITILANTAAGGCYVVYMVKKRVEI
jgi:hypothetical protein